MKNQTFGIEIEFTGITREQAANTIADYLGTTARYIGGSYDAYEVKAPDRRIWKIMSDGSIKAEHKNRTPASDKYKVELVSPICKYEDIPTVQELVRKLRAAGMVINSSAGIHIHIGLGEHTPQTLKNLANLIYSKEHLIYRALNVNPERSRFCKPSDEQFIEDINKKKPKTMEDFADIWYARYAGDRTRHYRESRYHLLNLHSSFTKGTIEFRGFNSTTHAGKIKAAIQFCLAVSHQALTQKSASKQKSSAENEKYTFRCWLLRLGMIGEEYKTARLHLLESLTGNSAWRHPESI